MKNSFRHMLLKFLKSRNFQNNSGAGILQVLMIASLVLVISTGLLILSDYNKKNLNSEVLKVSARLLTNSFFGLINDDTAWRNTTIANASMTCILNGTNCAAFSGTFTQFIPRGIDNTLYLGAYDPVLNPNQGFTPENALCTTYSLLAPSNRCPLRYTFWWQPICPPGPAPCIQKNIRVEIRAAHSPQGTSLRLNTTIPQSSYSISFIRGVPDPAKAAVNCASLNRSWDPLLFLCNMPGGGDDAELTKSCTLSSYDTFQRPNGICPCPVKCYRRISEDYLNVNYPNPYTLTIKCSCPSGTI